MREKCILLSYLGNPKLKSLASAVRPEKMNSLEKYRKLEIKLSFTNKWLEVAKEFSKVTVHKIDIKISTAILNTSWNILKTVKEKALCKLQLSKEVQDHYKENFKHLQRDNKRNIYKWINIFMSRQF